MKPPQQFTNRELAMLMQNIKEHHMESFNVLDKKLEQILIQTTRTNGRVSGIEMWKANIEGRLWVVPIIVSAVIAGVVKLVF
jgi:hypothetical protein